MLLALAQQNELNARKDVAVALEGEESAETKEKVSERVEEEAHAKLDAAEKKVDRLSF